MHLIIETGSRSYNVEVAGDFGCHTGVTNNGKQFQLRGHALAEVVVDSEGINITLHHAETDPSTGDYDVIVRQHGNDADYTFHHGPDSIPFTLHDDATLKKVWPTGAKDLGMTVMAIERFLKLNYGRTPHFEEWLLDKVSDLIRTPY